MKSPDRIQRYPAPASTAAGVATALTAGLITLPLWWLLTTTLQHLGVLTRPLQPPDDTRLSLWLGVSLLLLCWAPARRVGTGLVTRFDNVVLRPPTTPDLTALAINSHTAEQLRHWCFEGSGTGAAPLFLPNAIPAMEKPLSVALWESAPALERAAQQAQLNAFMGQLDGTGLLLACKGPWARRWLRLRIKLREAMWWRIRQANDPWDCGFLNTDADALARWMEFTPRRATLIVAQGVSEQALLESLKRLREKQSTFKQPVRLLVVASFDLATVEHVFRVQNQRAPSY